MESEIRRGTDEAMNETADDAKNDAGVELTPPASPLEEEPGSISSDSVSLLDEHQANAEPEDEFGDTENKNNNASAATSDAATTASSIYTWTPEAIASTKPPAPMGRGMTSSLGITGKLSSTFDSYCTL